MSITDTIADLVIARWSPGDWLSIDDVVSLSLEYGITSARSTIQRTMQDLRDRGIVTFVDYKGTYQRRPIGEDHDASEFRQLEDAHRSREIDFAGKPRLQSLVDIRIRKLTAEYSRQRETSLRDVPEIIDKLGIRSTETVAKVMTRLGQGQFRSDLISYWGACVVTGVPYCQYCVRPISSHGACRRMQSE
jgi:hypothetical protein